MYVFQLFDYYACNGTRLLFFSVFEAMEWIFGVVYLLSGGVPAPDLQPLVCVPWMGACSGLAVGPLLHRPGPSVGPAADLHRDRQS